MLNIKPLYVLANVNKSIVYLKSENTLTTSYEDAMTFNSKEDAISFLDDHFDSISNITFIDSVSRQEMKFAWTTREFFVPR